MPTRRLVLAALGLLPTLSLGAPAAPINGAEYLTLPARLATRAAPAQIEVIEFFMYHCPYCYQLEPQLADWVKRQGKAIAFRRVHIPYTGAADPEAHLFLTVEAMGKGEQMFSKIEHAVHVERVRLNQDGPILEWAVNNGLDRAQFLEAWQSFGVTTALRRLPRTVADYGITSAPQLVVDGRYVTSPGQAVSRAVEKHAQAANQAVIAVLDVLVAKAQAEQARQP
ncbi:thiol:disulfide interchange protein DsbA/DsbL [Massilia sp. DWR3-1-1]|uniref:thiol:disulfide interchange protein DsbA/DsbL n=1 Tax=Massilia sp. DWR3-1-1 TaxID=2804559 RepID=UPI003CE7E308